MVVPGSLQFEEGSSPNICIAMYPFAHSSLYYSQSHIIIVITIMTTIMATITTTTARIKGTLLPMKV